MSVPSARSSFDAAACPLRVWQQRPLAAYEYAGGPQEFLVTAAPGSGKTTFALALGPVGADFDGYVTTYAQVAGKPLLLGSGCRTCSPPWTTG